MPRTYFYSFLLGLLIGLLFGILPHFSGVAAAFVNWAFAVVTSAAGPSTRNLWLDALPFLTVLAPFFLIIFVFGAFRKKLAAANDRFSFLFFSFLFFSLGVLVAYTAAIFFEGFLFWLSSPTVL